MRLYVGQVTTHEAWNKFEGSVRSQLDEEHRQNVQRQTHYQIMRENVKYLSQTHFADLASQRIEYPRFKSMGLEDRIREILADTDPEIVKAVAELGLVGTFSNKVHETIKRIAKEALDT